MKTCLRGAITKINCAAAKMDETFEINSNIDPFVRQQSVDHILNILRELTPEEAYLFDRNDVVSDISELSDPFLEMAEYQPKAKPKVEAKVKPIRHIHID